MCTNVEALRDTQNCDWRSVELSAIHPIVKTSLPPPARAPNPYRAFPVGQIGNPSPTSGLAVVQKWKPLQNGSMTFEIIAKAQ